MASSYYPLGSAIPGRKTYQAVIGITGPERSKDVIEQFTNALKKNDNLFVKRFGYSESIPKKKFRQSYSDYTPKGIFKKGWFEKHTLHVAYQYCTQCRYAAYSGLESPLTAYSTYSRAYDGIFLYSEADE